MAHRIESGDQVIYTQGETPWHGLARKVSAQTVRDAVKEAGINWEVKLIQLSVPNDVTGKWEQVQAFAVVRKTDGKVLSAGVGKQYRPIQNESAFEKLLTPFVDSKLVTIETAGSLRGGGRVFISAKVNAKPLVIVPKASDTIELYLMAAHGHDGSLSLHYGFTGTRPVCDNTVSAATAEGAKSGMLRIRHTSGAGNAMNAAVETIARAGANFEKAADVFRALAGKYVTAKQLREYVDKVFPPVAKKETTTPAPEVIKAALDEWTDEATSPDVSAPDMSPPPAAVDFASMLARPVSAAVMGRTTIGADFARIEAKASKADDSRRVADNIVEIFEAGGRRGDLNLPGVKGTGWAAYNAVTEYLTWHRGANAENRFNTLHFQDQGINARALTAAKETFLG